MTVKAIARHARPRDGPPGAARLRADRFPVTEHDGATPGAPAARRADPLTGPIAITQPPVLGDQLRRPIVWCEIGPCVFWHQDPAALGEADIRARAIGAGWRHDAVGRLACPGCQQRSPDVWATYPVVLHAGEPSPGHRRRGDHAGAGVPGGALSTVTGWLGDRGRSAVRWQRLLAALATSGNGWNTPPWGLTASPPGRPAGLERQVTAVLPKHRATRHSPASGGRNDDRGQDRQQRENDHGHEHMGAWLWRLMPPAHSHLPWRQRRNRSTQPGPAAPASDRPRPWQRNSPARW